MVNGTIIPLTLDRINCCCPFSDQKACKLELHGIVMLVFVLADIILSLAFASGVKTVIPLPRNRLTILKLY